MMLAPDIVPRSQSTGVPGWETVAEEETLIALARQFVPDAGIIVELGGEYGRSASQFGYACQGKKDITIHTIDLFPLDHHFAAPHGGLLNVWRSNLAEAKLGDHHCLFLPTIGESATTGRSWTAPINLLFIDAGHAYEEVKADVEAWYSHVVPGGVMIFHDYAKDDNAHYLHKEVKRAVDEWHTAHGEWVRVDAADSIVYFVKPLNQTEQPSIKKVTRKK